MMGKVQSIKITTSILDLTNVMKEKRNTVQMHSISNDHTDHKATEFRLKHSSALTHLVGFVSGLSIGGLDPNKLPPLLHNRTSNHLFGSEIASHYYRLGMTKPEKEYLSKVMVELDYVTALMMVGSSTLKASIMSAVLDKKNEVILKVT